MIEVVQVFDRERIAELPTDDASALETKLATARARFQDRAAWLQPHERMAVLHKLAGLVEKRSEAFATLIAREGGKPYSDALVETDRAIDGIRNAADLLRTRAGVEIPMGLTPASENRRAWTVKEPIGVVAAISAFNHPLNLIVHQVAPAIATGCPVVVKPAMATPLCCLELVKLVQAEGFLDVPEMRAIVEGRDTAVMLRATQRAEFTGEGSSDPRRGHIPGSASLPYVDILTGEGMLDLPRLRQEIERLGIRETDRLALYCGGGVNAAGLALGLSTLGLTRLSVFDGSLNEWRADPSLPVETGDRRS
jgi:rhodanese-related sulfurtransferase